MSQPNSSDLKKLEVKLESLMRCVLNKAATDAEFARQLEEILLSDSISQVVSTRKSKPARIGFQCVDYLHQHGEDKLREELDSKTDSELRQILREESNKKAKDVKTFDRQQLIDTIIANADRVLNQGSAFLHVSDSVDPPFDMESETAQQTE